MSRIVFTCFRGCIRALDVVCGRASGAAVRSRFGRDRQGNIGMVFAMSAVPVLVAIGAAVDYGRATDERTYIQAILDSAVLAAGREYQVTGDPEVARDRAYAFASAELATGTNGIVTFTRDDVTVDEDNSFILASARSDVPTTFLKLMSVDGIEVEIRSESGLARGGMDENLEVSMMLDVTGSMSGQKLTDLKEAAKDLINIVIQDDQSEYTSRVGLVPFSQAVNAGDYFGAVTGYNGTSDDENGDGYKDGTPQDMIDDCERWRNRRPARFNRECSQHLSSGELTFEYDSRCVVERGGDQKFTDDAPNAGSFLGIYDDLRSQANHNSMSTSCRPEDSTVIPLTSSTTTLEAAIDAFVADGYTAGHLGTAWAWYMLSPKWNGVWPNESQVGPYDDEGTRKIAILMTDGVYNTYYVPGNGDSNVQAKALCDGMKTAGITVYTVGFELTDQNAVDVMKYCATSEEMHYFLAEDGNQLKMAFREIGFRVTQLRLTR